MTSESKARPFRILELPVPVLGVVFEHSLPSAVQFLAASKRTRALLDRQARQALFKRAFLTCHLWPAIDPASVREDASIDWVTETKKRYGVIRHWELVHGVLTDEQDRIDPVVREQWVRKGEESSDVVPRTVIKLDANGVEDIETHTEHPQVDGHMRSGSAFPFWPPPLLNFGQLTVLAYGLLPREQGDKWFIYWDWQRLVLSIVRATNYALVFEVHFEPRGVLFGIKRALSGRGEKWFEGAQWTLDMLWPKSDPDRAEVACLRWLIVKTITVNEVARFPPKF